MNSTPVRTNPWLACWTPVAEARLRLFCFPYAGSGASVYRGWSRDLRGDVEVCPVQYPGRETRIREPAQTSLMALVQQAATGLADRLDRPYAFFGHSMGALVAFELARELAKRGLRPPEHVVLSGFRSPLLPYVSALPFDLPTPEFVDRLRQLDGTPKQALDCPELLDVFLPILRADCQACDEYRLTDRAPLACPMAVFGGVDDPDAGEDVLRQWQALAGSSFTLRMFDGGHFFVQSARAQVLAELSTLLQSTPA